MAEHSYASLVKSVARKRRDESNAFRKAVVSAAAARDKQAARAKQESMFGPAKTNSKKR